MGVGRAVVEVVGRVVDVVAVVEIDKTVVGWEVVVVAVAVVVAVVVAMEKPVAFVNNLGWESVHKLDVVAVDVVVVDVVVAVVVVAVVVVVVENLVGSLHHLKQQSFDKHTISH